MVLRGGSQTTEVKSETGRCWVFALFGLKGDDGEELFSLVNNKVGSVL